MPIACRIILQSLSLLIPLIIAVYIATIAHNPILPYLSHNPSILSYPRSTLPSIPYHPHTADMAWRASGRTNTELISNLFTSHLITSSRVRDAMTAVDRAHYAPYSAYEDSPQGIGFGATISAPHMHASASESLLPFIPENKGARVLDVGSGSGYLTHVLANIVCGPQGNADGTVIGIDHIQGLVDLSTRNMRKSAEGTQLLDTGKVQFILGDGRKGYAAGAPYDAIHVGAAAKDMHQDLIDQLKSPGRMFIPVGDEGGWGSQWIWVVDKDKEGRVSRRKDMGVRYVLLTDAPRRN